MEGTSVRKFTRIGLFCGSCGGKDSEFYRVACYLGEVLAKRKINLVYGGGSLGLMEGVSTSALLGGSRVLGIIPKALNIPEICGITLGDELQVTCIQDRMANIMFNSEAFIVLPGGFGTLAELFQVLSWSQLNIHNKPIGLLNVNGFYDGLLSFLDNAVEQEFITPLARRLLVTAPTVEQLIDELHAFVPKLDPAAKLLDWSNKPTGQSTKLDTSLSL